MKDTLRLLLFWKCNLHCSYCCNEIPSVRKNILPIKLEDINFDNYKNICISGGEPFLNPKLVYEIVSKTNKPVYIYSNGIKITKDIEDKISSFSNVKGINIGLHYPNTFDKIISKLKNNPLIRFHVEDIYKDSIEYKYSNIKFKYWKRNDCEMLNEDIRILE